MALDGEKFGREIVQIVKDYVRRQAEPLEARIAALESRLVLLEAQATTKAKSVHRIAAPTRVAER